MKKNMKGILLGTLVAGMTMAAAMTALASDTVNVTVPNVRGGYLRVYYDDEKGRTYLPIGETSVVPKNVNIRVSAEPIDYEPSDLNGYWESFLCGAAVNGELLDLENYGSQRVVADRDLVFEAEFKGIERLYSTGTSSGESYDLGYLDSNGNIDWSVGMYNAGNLSSKQLVIYDYNQDKSLGFVAEDITIVEQYYFDTEDEYYDLDNVFEISESGILSANQPLEKGEYYISGTYEYNDRIHDFYLDVYVGASVNVRIPYVKYKYGDDSRYYSLRNQSADLYYLDNYTTATYKNVLDKYLADTKKTSLAGYTPIGIGYYASNKGTFQDTSSGKVINDLEENYPRVSRHLIYDGYEVPVIEPLEAVDIVAEEVQPGWNEINGKWYYYESEDPTSLVKNEWIVEGDKKFYVGADGAMKTSEIVEIEGVKYFFNNKGELATNKVITINGVKYEADSEGALTIIVDQGWNEIDGKWYFYHTTSPNSLAKDEWITDRGGEFYVDKDGVLVTNSVVKFEGKEYVVDSKGKKVVDGTIVIDGIEYETDEEGILQDKSVVLATPSNAEEAIEQTDRVLENLDIMDEDEKIAAADMLTAVLIANNKTSELTAEEVAKFEEFYYTIYGEENILVESGDAIAAGLVAAAGLKSEDFEDGKAEIEFATEWISTSSNAQQKLDVKLFVNGGEKKSLAAPIEFEIDLPEAFIASYSNATIKVENVDDYEVDMEAGVIRVKISKLSVIKIVATFETSKKDEYDDRDDNEPAYTKDYLAKMAAAAKAKKESGTWMKDDKGWYFKNTDGTYATNGWLYLTWNGQSSWYYFDANGYMTTGWVLYNGNWYYLHPTADGTQGYMYTGWNQINGIWYYFSEVKDSTEGMMLSNTTTPDGYKVGADGAWIQ
ncbi:MAG: hypothetical protein IKU20_06465 [Lachnospiraceae bacterium]|nr:hypothetical protein [Lachnospiraceae bacterium]